MRRIYLASPWVRRDTTRVVRDALEEMGYIVTSRWLDAPDGLSIPGEELARSEAMMDLEDIDTSDTFCVLTDPDPIGAGHHVEFGYALSTRKTIIVVGPVKSVFHYLADHVFNNWLSATPFFKAGF